MKSKFIVLMMSTIAGLLVAGCSPDTYSLGEIDVTPEDLVEGIAFKIEHDAANPNVVHLTSLMGPEYTPLWETPQGRSQETVKTLEIAFPGEYEVKFGVETRGGIVYGAPAKFTIDEFYSGFVNDPLWTMLTGGVGESRTWYIDIDAEEISRYWLAPKTFWTEGYNWNALHTAAGLSYMDDGWNFKNAIAPFYEDPTDTENSAAKWYWMADYAGNTWMCAAEDYGTMTFDLQGAPNVTIVDGAGNTTKGTFMLNLDDMSLTFNDINPLAPSGTSSPNRSYVILHMTDDVLQIGFVGAGTDETHSVNYISKDFRDNWTPPDTKPEPTEPQLPDGWLDDVSEVTISTTEIKWVLSDQTPFDWTNLTGGLLNGFSSPEDYPDWSGWGPASSNTDETWKNFSLTLDSKDNTAVYVNNAGQTAEGTYSIDEKGIYTFDGFDISVKIGGQTLNTTDGTWRILNIQKDPLTGRLSQMWVGVPNGDKPEYFAICLVPQSAGGDSEEPQGTLVEFDQSKIQVGDFESKGNLRIELYNDYGNTKNDPPFDPALIVFNNALKVTFTISGATLVDGAAGTYNTDFVFSNVNWGPGGTPTNVEVTGDGTYSVIMTATNSDPALVFCVDVVGMWADLADTGAVTATVDSIELF